LLLGIAKVMFERCKSQNSACVCTLSASVKE
jgi:hypothetical protein